MSFPAQIGRYRILGALGGGTSVVYLGRDEALGLDVAVKTLSPHLAGDVELRARHHREGQILARLQHPNIVTLHEYGEHEGVLYLVLERLRGTGLRDAIKGGISLKVSLPVVVQVLAGLAHIHLLGIVHRDIKPENIMIAPDGTAKIMDFGIAKLMDAGVATMATGNVVGTPDYMSPEQVFGAKVDSRSDLFAVGGVLYELIAGRRPFHADNLMAIFYNITHQEPDESLIPQGPQWERLRGVIRRALPRKPDDRYPDASAMSADLVLALETLGGEAEWKTPSVAMVPARAFRFETRSPVTRPSTTQPGVSVGIRAARALFVAVARKIRAVVRGV